MSRIVGIDLGTSTSEISYLKEGKPFIIPNNKGEGILPSFVGIANNGELVVGQEAKDQLVLRPNDTVMEIKRLMGSNEKVKLGDKSYTPEEISSFIIGYLKEYAQDYLGEEVTRAVITVPAYFTDQQRRATIQAGKLAGLEVERIINEPTAAALTYGIYHMEEQEHILVYDLGGGTLDVTVLEMFDGVLEVKASSGNNQLGGKEFDERLMRYLTESFMEQNQIDLSKDAAALAKLKKEAELCKISLSDQSSTQVYIPFIAQKDGNPIALEQNITKEVFESLIKELVESTKQPIEVALKDAGLKPEDIHKILLVGGSTRIPLVREFIEEVLGQEPKSLLDPDLAVAMGAAIQGAILNEELSHENDLMITDVCPYTLGIEVVDYIGGFMQPDVLNVIIPRNTTIPVWKEQIYGTCSDYQDAADVVIYQGDKKKASLNNSLGRFTLKGIPLKPAGEERVKVRFTYDSNGLLQVEGTILSTGKKAELVIDTMSIGLADEVDFEKWVESPHAKKYRIQIKKAERVLKQLEEEWEQEQLEEVLNDLKRAIVLGASESELKELKEVLEDCLFDLELQ